MLKDKRVKRLVLTGAVAAIYIVVTLALHPFSFGPIQLRVSEVMSLLVFINPIFAPGIVLGCFVANLGSPYPLDWLFGTLHSAVGLFFVAVTGKFIKTAKSTIKLIIASIWPTVFMFIIAIQIMIYSVDIEVAFMSFVILTLTLMAGQFVAVTVIGVPLFYFIMKNERLVNFLKSF